MDLYFNKLEKFEKEVKEALKDMHERLKPYHMTIEETANHERFEEVVEEIISNYEIFGHREAMKYLMYWDAGLMTSIDLAIDAGYQYIREINPEILGTLFLQYQLRNWWEKNKDKIAKEVE